MNFFSIFDQFMRFTLDLNDFICEYLLFYVFIFNLCCFIHFVFVVLVRFVRILTEFVRLNNLSILFHLKMIFFSFYTPVPCYRCWDLSFRYILFTKIAGFVRWCSILFSIWIHLCAAVTMHVREHVIEIYFDDFIDFRFYFDFIW